MGFMDQLDKINSVLNDFIWSRLGVYLLIAVGIMMTIVTGFFQVGHFGHWWKQTVGQVFRSGSSSRKKTDRHSISQFQALCTALSATIGTGNIAGVAGAICIGGPGAVFWMWIAAFFGMMTNYSENVLGIYFRRKNSAGEWCGGAMYYLEDGLGSKKHMKTVGRILAIAFACFAVLASFGIGNMGQVNKIVLNVKSAFFSGVKDTKVGGISVISLVLGLVILVLASMIIIGGLQRIAAFAEKIVPFMSVVYILGGLAIFVLNISNLGAIFTSIFKYAFSLKAVEGGTIGALIKIVVTQGFKRGVFSNEAGLGSSVMVHSASNVKEPVRQGMWGIFEVFFDTIIVCTMTAIIVLSSGKIDLTTGAVEAGTDDSTLVAMTFGKYFGRGGEMFVAIAMFLFAFTTILGWSQYGSKAIEYLFGEKAIKPYCIVFSLMTVSGAVMTSSLAWDISDTFNGFMMLPNLIGVAALSPLVFRITKNYAKRKLRKNPEDIEPLVSYDPAIQTEHAEAIRNGEE